MSQALNGINLENVSVSVEQKEVIRNIVVLKKDTYFFTCFGKSFIFQLLPFVFVSRHGSSECLFWLFRP